MIDFSTLKELYVDGKKVTSLFLDGHEVPVGGETSKYLTITALDQPAGVTITAGAGSPLAFSLEYSRSAGLWSSYSAEQTINLAAGESVMFRRVGEATTAFSWGTNSFWMFSFSANVKVSGNIMSLVDASMQSTTVGAYAFYRLFTASYVADASELELPATTLATQCYAYMFYNNYSLSAAPAVLPALSVAPQSYQSMFESCRFTTAPLLCTTTTNNNGVRWMFNHCVNLSSLSVNFTSWSGANWVENITGFGEFHCPSILGTDATIQRGAGYCPQKFVVGNYDVDGSLMNNAAVRTSYTTAFLEDGYPHCPTANQISVFNGNTCQRLVDNTDYTITFPSDTTTAGVKTISLNGIGSYSGTKQLTYVIFAKTLANCTKNIGPTYDDDGPSYTTIVQPDVGYTLVEGTDYTVSTTTVGNQSTVTITGIGSWTGTYTTTVEHKTSGTTPVAIYKHSPESQNPVYVRLQSNGGPINTVVIDEKPMSDPNASWTQLGTSYVSDSAGFWLRARDKNQAIATGDNFYVWIDCGYGQSNAATVDISGDIVSLIDRSQTQTAISASNTFNSTFQNNDKILDASKLSCSAKTITATDRAMRRLFASRGSRFGALDGNPQILTAIPEFEGLSVTTNGSYVYLANFQKCTALTSVTMQLPWPLDSAFRSDIANQQFVECSGLVSAVVKSHFGDGKACPDNYLAGIKMLDNAFSHCTSLTCISTDLTAWPGHGFTNWLTDVAATGTFICPTALGTDATIQRGASYCPTGWTVVNYDA